MTTLNNILAIILIFLVFVIMVLSVVYASMLLRQKSDSKEKESKSKQEKEKGKSGNTVQQTYNVKSVFDFMEFDKVEDNMIVQNNGKKFLMAIECQGINYDLMSEIEQNSVETGFMQFLNTIREPVQIYIQSRTINLEQSIDKYKNRIKEIESSLRQKESRYRQLLDNPNATQQQIDMQKLEVVREKNLLDYGKDIVANTERMCFNKNILRKKYFIILSYYHSENAEGEYYDDSEISEIAFSELYTKAQTIIRAISTTGVIGHVADSYELVDLLYNAYNKDEAETYGANRAYMGGFDELYVTAQDIFARRMKALDEKIEKDAIKLAEKAITNAQTSLEQIAAEKENNMDDLVNQLAKELIDENRQYLGDELTDLSMKDVDTVQEREKEETKDAKKGRKKGQ